MAIAIVSRNQTAIFLLCGGWIFIRSKKPSLSPINSHPKLSCSLYRNSYVSVPDPIFSHLHTKEKIAVWLRETIL